MIGFLHGRIAAKTAPTVTLDVGGVGYELEAPMSTFLNLPAVGESVRLITHLVVREDAHILYGFATAEERARGIYWDRRLLGLYFQAVRLKSE